MPRDGGGKGWVSGQAGGSAGRSSLSIRSSGPQWEVVCREETNAAGSLLQDCLNNMNWRGLEAGEWPEAGASWVV